MNMQRRAFAALVAACALAAIAPVHAQAWPTKPVRIVVPFPPGGTTDIVARSLGAELQKMWGQPVVIDNRAGAGGNIGADAVAKSPADGYTVLMGTVGTHAINAALFAHNGQKMPFDPVKDFVPGHALRGGAERDGDQSQAAGEFGARVHPVREGQSRQAQHGLERKRHVDPPGRRTLQDRHGDLHGPLPVSRLRARHNGPDRRQHERDVRQPALRAARTSRAAASRRSP